MNNNMQPKYTTLSLSLAFFVGLAACSATTSVEQTMQAQKTEDAQAMTEPKNVKTGTVEGDKAVNDGSVSSMSIEAKQFPLKLWQRNPNSTVYNQSGEKVDSLRLRAHVSVQVIENDKAIIDTESGYWVKLSDLTDENPRFLLERPENSNGLPRVTIDESMRNRTISDDN